MGEQHPGPDAVDPAASAGQQQGDDVLAQVADHVTGAGALLAADAIAKINAGAQLVNAVFSLPADVVTALFSTARKAFINAYEVASQAYGIRKVM